MNDQLQGKLVEILSNIESATKQAGDFALDQLPEVGSQYLVYARTLNTIVFFLSFAVVVGIAMWMNKQRRKDESVIPFGLIAMVLPFFTSMIFFSEFLKVWIAPKVFLLEEFAKLVR